MSAQTLQAIQDAIVAHHSATTDETEKPERAGALITAWVVGYELGNFVDVGEADGGQVFGYANDYVTSDASPNLLTHLAQWVATEIDAGINGADDDDD